MIELLGLGNLGRTPFRRLSGGEQRRVSLAIALIGRPELVILDEPTAGMDPQGRRLVWDVIRQLRDQGVSVLLSTHLMDEAADLADHVVIIDHGEVIAQGSPSELTADGVERLHIPSADVNGVVGRIAHLDEGLLYVTLQAIAQASLGESVAVRRLRGLRPE